MTNDPIENVLRKAPRPAPPAGLKERLEAHIALSRASEARRTETTYLVPFWRRWFPALAFGMIFLTCFVILAVQTNQILQLRRENEALRVATANLEQLRQENQELLKLSAQAQQLERLRKDNLELQQLRAEIENVRGQALQLAQLQAEQQRLLAERAAQQAQASVPAEEDPFAEAKAKAMRINCLNNLKQIGLAARIWSNKHQDILPEDFLTMSNELNTPKILVCPADRQHAQASNWAEFGPANSSYEILSPGINELHPDVVYVRCPIHHNVGTVDGAAHQLGPSQPIIEVDGLKKIGRAEAAEEPKPANQRQESP